MSPFFHGKHHIWITKSMKIINQQVGISQHSVGSPRAKKPLRNTRWSNLAPGPEPIPRNDTGWGHSSLAKLANKLNNYMVCRWYIYSEWDYNPFRTRGHHFVVKYVEIDDLSPIHVT